MTTTIKSATTREPTPMRELLTDWILTLTIVAGVCVAAYIAASL